MELFHENEIVMDFNTRNTRGSTDKAFIPNNLVNHPSKRLHMPLNENNEKERQAVNRKINGSEMKTLGSTA